MKSLDARPSHLLSTLFTFLVLLVLSSSSSTTDDKYAVIVDAGSSGTRVWIYRWNSQYEQRMPRFVAEKNKKWNPGLSQFADDRQELMRRVTELLDFARSQVPERVQSETPIYILATAGMRLLLESHAYDVIESLMSIAYNRSLNPFLFNSTHNVRILSGEEEGVFAWIAVNYLNGAFENENEHTRGIIELGGASTQIAFIPRGSILADKFPFRIRGKRYAIYAHSYLHYGQDYVEIWIMEYLLLETSQVDRIFNPCLLIEEEVTWNGTIFVGTGKPDECNKILKEMITKSAPRDCFLKPCAIGSVYQPSIPSKQKFYALGVFNIIMRDLLVLNEQLIATPSQVYSAAYDFCKLNHSELLQNVPARFLGREMFISKPCVMGLYLHLLMTRAYGFLPDSNQLIGTEIINGVRADWTLGALIYEMENDLPSNNCNDESRMFLPSSSASHAPTSSVFNITFCFLLLIFKGQFI